MRPLSNRSPSLCAARSSGWPVSTIRGSRGVFAQVRAKRSCRALPWTLAGGAAWTSGNRKTSTMMFSSSRSAAGDQQRRTRASRGLACGDRSAAWRNRHPCGCGTGYYTAMLSRLVGPAVRSRLTNIEADLAAIAATNLATVCQHPRARAIGLRAIVAGNRYHLRQCRGDGAGRPLARCDKSGAAADLSLAAPWGLGAGDPGAAKAGRLFGQYPHERRLHPLAAARCPRNATRRFPQRQTSGASAPYGSARCGRRIRPLLRPMTRFGFRASRSVDTCGEGQEIGIAGCVSTATPSNLPDPAALGPRSAAIPP